MSAEELRRHNLNTILDQLHLSGPSSRSDLARQTGLNRSTIGDLVGELRRLGLVEESQGVTGSGPGRPSPVARVRPEGATVLALELSVDSIAVATIGLGGHVYNQIRVARPRERFSPEETVEDIAKLAEPLLGSLPTGRILVGVGVGVAGVVRRRDGFVHLAPNLGWRDVPLGKVIGDRLGLSEAVGPAGAEPLGGAGRAGGLWLGNEADLGALAEYRRGEASGALNLLYLAGEVGIGAGIIQDGRPMLGVAGYAGEVGHTRVNPDGRPCRCGGRGCWETEAGESALAERIGITDLVGQRLVEEVVFRAQAGDSRTLEGLGATGSWLGVGIGNLINVFNPDRVVIGGIYHELYPYLEQSLRGGVKDVALRSAGESAQIVRGGLGVDAALMGAAELVFSDVITNPAKVAGIEASLPVADG